MHIELHCPDCRSQFGAAADTPADAILDRMMDEGPWYALAGGETFEDMVRAALAVRGRILCPDCGRSLAIRARGLYRPTRELIPCG
jgi:hypothetical protein